MLLCKKRIRGGKTVDVRLKIGEPIVVKMGVTYESAPWGPYQFPMLRRLPDGRIALQYHAVADNCEAYGQEKAWAVSEDEGKSWRELLSNEVAEVIACFGERLPSGKYIDYITHKPYLISDEYHAELTRIARTHADVLAMEELPDLFPKTYTFRIADPKSGEVELFDCELDFPGMTTWLCQGAIVRPTLFSKLRVAPDGTLWLPHYIKGRNPHNLGYTTYYNCYYFCSTDEGRSFQLRSWIQYMPDTNEFPEAFLTEGFCEPDICFMLDGSIITLMRTGFRTPSYLARSTDNGYTWSKPQIFDRCGVCPQLQSLSCGVTLASYGRPGLFVRATDDPVGQSWSDPVTLIPYNYNECMKDSCCYTSMIPLDDRTALLAYSDFRVQDGDGVARKCIIVRTVRVD